MVSDYTAAVLTGVLYAIFYVMFGLGTARATAKLKGRDLRAFDLAFWPIVLGVIAASGDIAD
jgi:hypothetical protein